MPTLHIANTFFEWELTQALPPLLDQAFAKHEVFLQLQFLPFLYASSEDGVLVSDPPAENYWEELKNLRKDLPQCHLISDAQLTHYDKIDSWGASRSIAKWAKTHQLSYDISNWETVCEVNSKAFSFAHSPKLEGAALVHTKKEALEWIWTQKEPFVFKTCFGMSGKGHLIADLSDLSKVEPFLDRELKSHPLIAEPWVDRVLDFSTQWEISLQKEIQYLGSTLCESDPKGRHKGNQTGKEDLLFGNHISYLREHKKIAFPLLEQMAKMGYFGNVGIDAMIYKKNEFLQLHPIVEINARKTMGWITLQLQHHYFPERILSVQYGGAKEKGLLPSHILRKEKGLKPFNKQLFFAT